MNKWFQSDIFLRFIAVVIAVIMWLTISDKITLLNNEKYSLKIPNVNIDFKYDKENFELFTKREKVDVTLIGSKIFLNFINQSSFDLFVDLRDKKEGVYTKVPIQIKGLMPNIKAFIQPPYVDLKLEKKIQKEFPVYLDIIGNLANGYSISKVSLKPSKVIVKGIKSKLDKITYVSVPVYLENLKDSVITKDVKVQVYGKEGIIDVDVYPKYVNVNIPILMTKEVFLKPNVVNNPTDGFTVEELRFKPNKVLVTGLKSYVEKMNFYSVKVDLSKFKKTTVVDIPLNSEKWLTKVLPKTVKLEIKLKKD